VGGEDGSGVSSSAEGSAELSAEQSAERIEAPAQTRLCFDAAELRRIIALSFSAGELSKFAERFKVFVGRQEPAQGARNLVRALEARGELERLVTNLREAKPLVEWPEGQVEAVEVAPVAAEPDAHRAPAELSEAVVEVAPAAEAPKSRPLVDPYLEQAAAEEAKPKRNLLLPLAGVFGAGLLLGAVGLWLLARDATPPPAGPALETGSVAQLAANHLERSVGAVMKSCDTKPAGSVRDTLADAFRRCGQAKIRPGVAPLVAPAPRPKPEPEPQRQAAPPKQGTPSRSPACLDRCHRMHAQCQQSDCGPEPRSSAKYASYQKCMSGCLTKYSRCRLSCR
jgi:hypothetical protein